MIKLINEDLFNITTTKEENEKGEFFKTVISSSVKVKQPKNNEYSERIVTTIISDTEDYNANPTALKASATRNGGTRISIRSNEKNKYDSNIYLVAIPFNGVLQEMSKTNDLFDFRIYRAFVLRSDKRNISFNGKLYKKIAYIMVVPNEAMLKEDHKYHKASLSMKLESYNLESIENSDEKKTLHVVDNIVFNGQGYETSTNEEEVDPIDTEEFKGKNIFPIYKMKKLYTKKKKVYDHQDVDNDSNLDKMLDNFNKESSDRQRKSNYNNNPRGKRR